MVRRRNLEGVGFGFCSLRVDGTFSLSGFFVSCTSLSRSSDARLGRDCRGSLPLGAQEALRRRKQAFFACGSLSALVIWLTSACHRLSSHLLEFLLCPHGASWISIPFTHLLSTAQLPAVSRSQKKLSIPATFTDLILGTTQSVLWSLCCTFNFGSLYAHQKATFPDLRSFCFHIYSVSSTPSMALSFNSDFLSHLNQYGSEISWSVLFHKGDISS